MIEKVKIQAKKVIVILDGKVDENGEQQEKKLRGEEENLNQQK